MPCIDCSENLNYSKNHVCEKCADIAASMDCMDDQYDLKVSETTGPLISDDGDRWAQEAVVEASNVMRGRVGNIYCILDAGMGCQWYICRNTTDQYKTFFMHGDNWGQYGPSTDDTAELTKFLEGYEEVFRRL